MEYRGSSIDCRSEVPAKAQRRKGRSFRRSVNVMLRYRRIAKDTLSLAPLRLCGILLLSIGIAFSCSAQARGPMRAADIVRVANVTDAQISPNGQYVVYTVSSIAADRSLTTLWIARLLPEVI